MRSKSTPSTAQEPAAVFDERIAAHKAALKLTPDQERSLWPPYEAALRRLALLRVERHEEQRPANPVALLRQRADDLTAASVALRQLADAEAPPINSLDDTQKHLFAYVRQQDPLIECQTEG